jgi:hypothetical protein
MKIGIRFADQNRFLIFPERFSIAIGIAIAVSTSGSGGPEITSGLIYKDWDDLISR